MINYEIHRNILGLDDLNLISNISALSARDKERIDAVNVLQVKEKAYFQRDMASIFRDFLGFCMKGHNVYFVLMEHAPEPRNRIRARKGLFYKHKGELDKQVLFETETEVTPDETLFSGIIRLTEQNIDYVLSCTHDFPLAFGFISLKRKRAYRPNRKDFLEAIVHEGLIPGNIYWKNWLKISSILVRPGRKFFYLRDLNDTEHFRVFYHKDDAQWGNQLESFISQELQTSPILQN